MFSATTTIQGWESCGKPMVFRLNSAGFPIKSSLQAWRQRAPIWEKGSLVGTFCQWNKWSIGTILNRSGLLNRRAPRCRRHRCGAAQRRHAWWLTDGIHPVGWLVETVMTTGNGKWKHPQNTVGKPLSLPGHCFLRKGHGHRIIWHIGGYSWKWSCQFTKASFLGII